MILFIASNIKLCVHLDSNDASHKLKKRRRKRKNRNGEKERKKQTIQANLGWVTVVVCFVSFLQNT